MASSSSSRFLLKAQTYPVIFASVYVVFLAALLNPWIQSNFLFLHKVQFPFFPDFNNPVRYGVAPHKGRNLRLRASDGIEIGAWHLVPDAFMREHGKGPYTQAQYDQSLRDYPTVIYLHGNAANRAAPFRIATYTQITARLQSNVVAIDYRGFGDSGGSPSEAGLVKDARAAWEWIQARREAGAGNFGGSGQKGEAVVVMGQSLGTGVAAQVTLELTKEGTPPQGLVLVAPYSSLRGLITSYRIGGVVPVFGPLAMIPFAGKFIDRALYTHFNTSAVLPTLFVAARELPPSAYPKVIMDHATNDEVIPFGHSEELFEGLLAHELGDKYPQDPFGGKVGKGAASVEEAQRTIDGLKKWKAEMQEARDSKVVKTTIEGLGTVETMRISHEGAAAAATGAEASQDAPSVTLIRTHHGGHNHVGEGVIDLIGEITGITV